MSLRAMRSPYYRRAGEAGAEAALKKTEPPFWLGTLRQPTIKPSPSIPHTSTPAPWRSLACRWGRPHFVICHWSWKSIQTDRQTDDMTGPPAAGFIRELSHTISYCNYHCRRDFDGRRALKAFLVMCISCNRVTSLTLDRQASVIQHVLDQDVILH